MIKIDTDPDPLGHIAKLPLIQSKSSSFARKCAVTLVAACALCAVSACATRTIEPFEYSESQYAVPPAPDGELAELASKIESLHGRELSGFQLLDRNSDAIKWRLALVDSARYTIDVQYYLWYGDSFGRILLRRLIDAADRGVHVRLLVDDLNTLLRDAGTVDLRDEIVVLIESHPNIELRLFNPWTKRNLAGRLVESAGNFKRVNQRMHNKVLIADNHAMIIGGRNIGDEYVGLNDKFNFHDLDVLGVGTIASQASHAFDMYWNSRWVVPAFALGLSISEDEKVEAKNDFARRLREDYARTDIPSGPGSWSTELDALVGSLHVGRSRVVADIPTTDAFDMIMLEEIRGMLSSADSQVMISNAYIIPTEDGISILDSLGKRGVQVKILTNSLASHDVPAVNSHYRKWRKPILQTGAELFELRHDGEMKATVVDAPPVRSKFMGLHSKLMVIDARHVFIGSMNYDPRSATLNTEMGAIIDSPGLGAEAVAHIERDTSPANSWQVVLDEDGNLLWTNDIEVTKRQPARNFWQRVQDVFFRAVPKEYY